MSRLVRRQGPIRKKKTGVKGWKPLRGPRQEKSPYVEKQLHPDVPVGKATKQGTVRPLSYFTTGKKGRIGKRRGRY